jgi:VIT1/CCC1 family predicted Fe2+/Mn2+ transporter
MFKKCENDTGLFNDMLSETEVENIAKKFFKTELTITAIYKNLSQKFDSTEEAKLFSHFSLEEEGHAKFWRNFLERRKIDPETIKINRFMVSILSFIYGLLGLGLTLKIFESTERRVIQLYARMFKSESLTSEEKEDITLFLLTELAHEEKIGEYEAKFDFFVNKIATIFTQTTGGLVLVLSTAIGLSSVYDNTLFIGFSGLIVGLTGALNTVVGFFFFGRTQKKVKEDILNRIKMTYACVPSAYVNRIKKCMQKRNYDEAICQSIADLAFEKQMVERIIAEEEYGIKEESLGNPMENAIYAGLFKVIGTIFPLLPYFAGYPVHISIPVSIIITLVLLSIAGTLVAIAAEVDIKNKVIELTSGGLVLVALTYILGKSASFLMTLLNLG